MKTIKVNHVVLTLKLTALGMGMERDQVDELVNKRLAEGYDQVDVYVPKTNLDERQAPNDIVLLYIFKANEDDEGERVATKSKKKTASKDA
jgi:hypothetical protein